MMGTVAVGNELEEEEEPILKEQKQRFCMFPIRYRQLWEMYKKAEASFWTGIPIFSSSSFFVGILVGFFFCGFCCWHWFSVVVMG